MGFWTPFQEMGPLYLAFFKLFPASLHLNVDFGMFRRILQIGAIFSLLALSWDDIFLFKYLDTPTGIWVLFQGNITFCSDLIILRYSSDPKSLFLGV